MEKVDERIDYSSGAGVRTDPVRNRLSQSHSGEDGASGVFQNVGTTRTEQTRIPALDVLPADQPTTTKAGKTRQRMTWTDDMNRHVMHCYYLTSSLETVPPDRALLRQLFLENYPEYTNVTEQRLIDQKRVIVKNNRLPLIQRETIKKQVAEYLARRPTVTEDNPVNIFQQDDGEESPDEQGNSESIGEQVGQTQGPTFPDADERLKAIRESLEEALARWRGIEPSKRPYLPKLQESKRTYVDVVAINKILPEYVERTGSLQELHTLIYCAATTILMVNEQKIHNTKQKYARERKQPWQIRLEKKVEVHRKMIGQTTQYILGNRSRRVVNAVKRLAQGKNVPIDDMLDTLKQKLAVYSNRLRRYKESHERKRQNFTFTNSEKKFYKQLESRDNIQPAHPNIHEIENFWENIWSRSVRHNDQALWLREEVNRYSDIQQQNDNIVTVEELQKSLQKSHNWKQPGTDSVQNFWYKKLTSTHKMLTKHINSIIAQPEKCPEFLTEGKTFIKPKSPDTQDPANYRPITCLQTLYKFITAIISEKINKHLTINNILTEEQKGCRKGSQGCKEQLVIDSIIMKQAEKQQRNLHTCYIDYKKAYDSVPHSWLQKVLEIYKIDPKLRKFLYHAMNMWKTTVHLNTDTDYIQTGPIKINRGIFQGDSLSALWFCMCLNSLSTILNNTNYGYKIKTKRNIEHTVSHLLYMDDIKLYAQSSSQMKVLMSLTEEVSGDVGMEFGVNKCKLLRIERGKWADTDQIKTLNNEVIETMQPQETYKYLGFQQNTRLEHTLIKSQLKEKYRHRLRGVLNSKLNARNLTKAVNTYAIPILSYSFGIIKWTRTDLEAINRLNRTEMTRYRKLHPKSCVERVTISRKDGGRGLLDISMLYQKQIVGLRSYFHDRDSPLHRTIVLADHNYTPLNLAGNMEYSGETDAHKKERWAEKSLHGRHLAIVQSRHVSRELSYKWLRLGYLFPETEGYLISIQDQVVATRNYQRYIIKDPQVKNDMCRKCHLFQETIDHITGGCKLLAATDYTQRHNNVAKIIHQALLQKYGMLRDNTPYYKYNPDTITENSQAKIYWDKTIYTDRTIPHNRPDITLIHKSSKQTFLIDIAVPNDNNVEHKEQEKRDKYLPLAIEVKELWRQEKVAVVPLVMSTTGITPNSFLENLKLLGLAESAHTTAQKSVILNTCSIVRKFLQQ